MKKVIGIMLILMSASLSFAQNWMSIGEGLGSSINRVKAYYWDEADTLLYMAGSFSYFDNIEVNGICKYDGNSIKSLASGLDNCSMLSCLYGGLCLEKYKNEIYLGHNKDTVDGVETYGIARWDGENWYSVGGGLRNFGIADGGTGGAMEVHEGDLYVGGYFDIVGTDTTYNLARWDGENWHAVNHPFGTNDFPVFSSMLSFDGYLYVGGNFATPNSGRNIARFDGENWETVGGGITGGMDFVEGIIEYKNELYIYGSFRKSVGNAGNKIMKLKNDEWVEVGGGIIGNTKKITGAIVVHNKLYVVGLFNFVDQGLSAENIAIWDGEKWCNLGTEFENSSTVETIGRFQNDFILSGNFKTVDGDSMAQVSRWIGGDYLAECGEIVSTTSEIDRQKIAVFPNPTISKIHINLEGIPISTKLVSTIIDVYGKTVAEYKFNRSDTKTINVEHLPSGIYFLKIETENQIFSKKFVKQ